MLLFSDICAVHHSITIGKTTQNLITKMVKMNPNLKLEMGVGGQAGKNSINGQHFTIYDKATAQEIK